MNKFRILSAVSNEYWALEPAYMARMSAVLQSWALGKSASPEVMADVQAAQAARNERKKAGANVGGGIAVLPLYGVVTQRASAIDEVCGGVVSTDNFAQSFRDAMADDSVSGIIIDIDSPGGSVFGVSDLYDIIMSARGVKPVYGFVNSLCASAAYWLGAACSQLYAVQGSMTGSIGVYTQHIDLSKALEMEGVSQEFISAGKYKVEGNSYGPLSDEARAFTQSQIDSYYAAFTQAVAKGRGQPIASVRDGMGQGRCLLPADALAANMIDGVDTFQGVVKRMKSAMKSGGVQATAEIDGVMAEGAVLDPNDAEMAERIANATVTEIAPELAAGNHEWRTAARERELRIAST
jgi:signal peptide peptidase SppA